MVDPKVLLKLERFCAYQERSQKQVEEKGRKLGLSQSQIDLAMVELIQSNFLNEERFALAYVKGKVNIKGWGKNKLILGLKRAGISQSLINKALQSVGTEKNEKALDIQIRKKLKSLFKNDDTVEMILTGNEKLDFETRNKLVRFLLGKGFEYDEINRVLQNF
jgi:regulatory protein